MDDNENHNVSDGRRRRGMTLEELQPDYDDLSKQPKTLTKTKHVDGVLYVAGRAPVDDQENYDVMFVVPSVEEEEAATAAVSTFGFRITQPAEYLKGSNGVIRDVALQAGVDMDQCYYTAVCKWVLPRAQRARPPVKVMNWGMPILMDEIRRVKPKIIVCMGKQPFDMLSDQKIGFKDAHGCWFWSTEAQAHLYVMYPPFALVTKPDMYETFRVDFKEVALRRDMLLSGQEVRSGGFDYEVIRNQQDLEDWLDRIESLAEGDDWPGHRDDDGHPLLAVDCEWHGRTHVDGQLRTMQVAWSEKDAVVIEFRNENNEWSFDVGLESEEEPPRAAGRPEEFAAPYGRPSAVEDDDHEALVQDILSGESGITLGDVCAELAEELGKDCSVDLWMMQLRHEPETLRRLVDKIRRSRLSEGSDTPGVSAKKSSSDNVRQQCANDATRRRFEQPGKSMSASFSRMDVRFIGHHFAADAPWMRHWLGIKTYEKCAMDTEFAQQTVDESSELGLERGIGMKYTSLGRYDRDLVMWKRDNKAKCKDGYGYIPSKILHPYGAADVIVPYRAYPLIRRQMQAQRLWDYYCKLFNPFVTDVFTEFTMTGLPMDVRMMDDLRELLSFARDRLTAKFQHRIHREAVLKMRTRLVEEFGAMEMARIEKLPVEEMMPKIKQLLAKADRLADVSQWLALTHHRNDSPSFNIRSPDQLRRWLFEVEGLTPIKSTNQKAKGLPSMAWEKVLELPKERQALYTPAVDKQTLSILSEKLPAIDELLNLNAVGNLSKAFLKEADVYEDPETGEESREEHGLHAWLASDGRIHGQYSATETGRPRSWAPNTLNWPIYLNKRVSLSVAQCVQEAHEEGDLPEHLMKWTGLEAADLPSIRSCVKAPKGWVLVESDYATAEMVALAKISGDKDLQRILEEPDPEWALIDPACEMGRKVSSVRVKFADMSVTGIPLEARNDDFIMKAWKDGEYLGDVTEDMLLRDDAGNVLHAPYDIHWSLAERTYGKCRESMKAKIYRNAAKVINFSSAYGATANSLERKIESDTGVKPDEGTGERGLEAIAARQPRATQFLEEMARVPKERGFYRAASGRVRHCILHGAGSGVGWRVRNSLESALGRELRNFPMQESVGSTSARACQWLLRTYRALKLKARPMTCLYDSVVSLCPENERFLVRRLHEICMSEINFWQYSDEHGDRTLRYAIDCDFNRRWSTPPSEEETRLLESHDYAPATGRVAWLTTHENLAMFVS